MLVRSSICLNRMGVSNNQQRRRLKSKEARGKEGVICRKEMNKTRHSQVHEHSRHENHLDAHRQVKCQDNSGWELPGACTTALAPYN